MESALIPVVWLTGHDGPASGYWDQGLLELIVRGEVWRPTRPYRFENHMVSPAHPWGDDDLDGAVVVIPGRHQWEQGDTIPWLNRQLERLTGWAFVIVTGDEEAGFDHTRLQHPNMVLWVQTPDLHRFDADPRVTRIFPEGYGASVPGTLREILAGEPPERRGWQWVFAGQVTHPRRRELVDVLRGISHSGALIETDQFLGGVPHEEYLAMLADSVTAPAPSGPATPETFRLYEALEAGCVAIVDEGPAGKINTELHPRLLGRHSPVRRVQRWTDLPALPIAYPADNAASWAWWQSYKRDLVHAFHAQIENRRTGDQNWRDRAAPIAAPSDITAVISTSPSPLHPSTDHLETVIESVRERLGPDVEIIISADGVRPEQTDRAEQYAEYLYRVAHCCATAWRQVVPIFQPVWGHQALTTRAALAKVHSPLVLFLEHDTPLEGDIDWGRAVATMEHLNVLRFLHESEILPDYWRMMLDGGAPTDLAPDGVPVVRTLQWSQRPHLAWTGFYRSVLRTYFGEKSRTMIEDVMHGVVDHARREQGAEEAWGLWRLGIYAADPNLRRSYHLDSRRDDEKFPMIYEYDERIPVGAPYPTSLRTD